MKVLHVSPAFYPAAYWGGPIFSTYGLCNALAAIPSVKLKVLTTDSAGPALSQRVRPESNPDVYPNGYEVYYCRRIGAVAISAGLLVRMWSLILWADVVHLTGIYSFPTIPTLLICRILNKPVMWSPRGALQATHAWPDARRRGLKRVWELLCSVVMPGACVLHTTSDEEKAASLARLPRAGAIVVRNGIEVPQVVPPHEWLPGGKLRLMFIGRLDRSKGIENLLEGLVQLQSMETVLDIYGSGDSRYSAELAGLVRYLGLTDRVTFRGFVEGEAKHDAFLSADICVVPSHSENFAMVVAEALAHGVPVIASKGTPWQAVEEVGCGLWVENAPDSLAAAIMRMRGLPLGEMGERGRAWMQQSYSWDNIAREMNAAYRELMGSHASSLT